MATIDPMVKFAEQMMKVEAALQQSGITDNPGRVVFVLTVANTPLGVSHTELVNATGHRKDVVSKLVGALEDDGLVTQERHSRTKRVTTTDSGRKLLSRVKASLRSRRQNAPEGKEKEELSFFDKDGNIVAIPQL
jgi:DNA-binding MarR family transcriptional regulator